MAGASDLRSQLEVQRFQVQTTLYMLSPVGRVIADNRLFEECPETLVAGRRFPYGAADLAVSSDTHLCVIGASVWGRCFTFYIEERHHSPLSLY